MGRNVPGALDKPVSPAGVCPAEEVFGMNRENEEKVLTPGGMRPKSVVHHVEPGQVVVGGGAPAPTASGELVLTPGGYRHRSLVHEIGPDHVLDQSGGTMKQLHISGREVADFGPIAPRDANRPLMPANVALQPGVVPALGSGWIAYADWSNTTGNSVTRFETTWIVPPAPSTDHGQTIFLFNGIQNSTMIYQPVLQWGSSAAGGGSYWAVSSWYVDGQGGVAFHSNLVKVSSGNVLTGVINQTGQKSGKFSYGCEFTGVANTSLPISSVEELKWNIETLEAYGVQQCSDYPDTTFTSFSDIALQTSAGNPDLTWAPVNAVTDCGQSAHVVSNANPHGGVEIYYRKPNSLLMDANITPSHLPLNMPVTFTVTTRDKASGAPLDAVITIYNYSARGAQLDPDQAGEGSTVTLTETFYRGWNDGATIPDHAPPSKAWPAIEVTAPGYRSAMFTPGR